MASFIETNRSRSVREPTASTMETVGSSPKTTTLRTVTKMMTMRDPVWNGYPVRGLSETNVTLMTSLAR